MRAAPTTIGQPGLFDAPPTAGAATPCADRSPSAGAGPTEAHESADSAQHPGRALRRAPGGPGRVILRPARRSIDVLDRPGLEALCHAFGLSVVGERDEVLRDRLSAHLRCR